MLERLGLERELANLGGSDFEQRKPAPGGGDASAGSETTRDFLGGRLWTFSSPSRAGLKVAVFVPKAALGQARPEVMFYVHGHLFGPCKTPRTLPEGLISETPFELGKLIDDCGRPIVLVVPLFGAGVRPKAKTVVKDGVEKTVRPSGWQHAGLGKPAAVNAVVGEALGEVALRTGVTMSGPKSLIVAGHSRAYDILYPLINLHRDGEFSAGALADLAHIWMLDASYNYGSAPFPGEKLPEMLRANPKLRATIAYRPGSGTDRTRSKANRYKGIKQAVPARSGAIGWLPLGKGNHCELPGMALPLLFASLQGEESEGAHEFAMETTTLTEDRARDAEMYEAFDEFEPLREASASSLRARIVDIARREWEAWSQGQLLETDPKAKGLLTKYWKIFAPRKKPEDFIAGQIKGQKAWSAAFISYVMKEAGAGTAFRYSGTHTIYIAAAKEAALAKDAAKFQAYEITTAKPQAGDLVCRDRPPKLGAKCAGTNFDNVSKGGISHSDIVMEVGPGYAVVMGGNTSQSYPKKGARGNTAGQRKIRLDDQGYVVPDQLSCRFFAIVKPPGGDMVGGAAADGPRVDVPGLFGDLWENAAKIAFGIKFVALLLAGVRDEDKLTNEAFAFRHPERAPGQKILASEKALAREWIEIRNKAVRPLIAKFAGKTAASPGPRAGSGSGLPVVAKPPSGVPTDAIAFRKFRLTSYHLAEQKDFPGGNDSIPIMDAQGKVLAYGSPTFFASLSLEGSGLLNDGRLVGVTSGWVAAKADDFAAVLEHHDKVYKKRNAKRAAKGEKPVPYAWSGLSVVDGRVVKVLSFSEKGDKGIGYGVLRKIPLVPFRTLAADIGKMGKSEPKWKDKGGVVPAGTKVYIAEYNGLNLPDGSTHDGWFTVNDTGGAIFGVHFDVFTGTKTLTKKVNLPEMGTVWFDGIEQRIPAGYSYGLSPI